MRLLFAALLPLVAFSVTACSATTVTLVEDGKANAVIYASAEVMAPDATPAPKGFAATARENDRQTLRASVNDLARCVEKMSGAKVEVVTAAPAANDTRIPIYIGALATRKFGEPKPAPYKQGFRVTVSEKAVGLGGESDLASSYAIIELLERLGCRWYMPSDLGEVIPDHKTITLDTLDQSFAPGTAYRGMWYADADFKRHIRQGGLLLSAGHALEISDYVSKKDLEAHPDWQGLVNGKRTPTRFCWGNPEVAAAVADGIIARLDADYTPTISISPNDGIDFCECDKCKALDAGDKDPSSGTVSVTDRYVHFANQIAARVTKKYPDVMFGFLAYGPTTRLPVREKLHPNLVPQIAPITYCRAHTMLQNDICPSRPMLKPIVEGWGKISKNVSYYNYMFHLAEVAVPYPMMKQMSDELPVIYKAGVNLWQPETLPNFESILPGVVIANAMAWDPARRPAAILDEFFPTFYGNAAVPMRQYWQLFDDAWTTVPEHAGCGFGYAPRFTPAFMKQARQAMDDAIAACKTDMEKRRVKIQDDALKQFELFMKLRGDLAEGRLTHIAAEAQQYLNRQVALGNEYAPQYSFTKVGWTPVTIGGAYFNAFFKAAYDDAGKILQTSVFILPPIREWRYQVDRKNEGESLSWQAPAFDDNAWKTTDPAVDSWFKLGIETYYGAVFYRANVNVPAVPAGKKVHLWISSTDGSAKVFVNGKHIPFVNEKGVAADPFTGYCQPASFDITDAIKPGAVNQITIKAVHTDLNELGTGGLLGPVYFYRDK